MHNAWLISFGDLLTLVLCFFICIISLSPVNPHVKSKAKLEGYPAEAATAADTSQSGTALALKEKNPAPKTVERRLVSVQFFEEDFLGDDLELSSEAVSRVKTLVPQGSYTVKQLKMETCWRTLETEAEASWEKSASLLSALRRQILDHLPSFAEAKVAMRSVGLGCAYLENAPEDRPMVAQIILELA